VCSGNVQDQQMPQRTHCQMQLDFVFALRSVVPGATRTLQCGWQGGYQRGPMRVAPWCRRGSVWSAHRPDTWHGNPSGHPTTSGLPATPLPHAHLLNRAVVPTGTWRAALWRLLYQSQRHGAGLSTEPKAQRVQTIKQRRQAWCEAFARGPREHPHRARHP
jgi:hypothetical protein